MTIEQQLEIALAALRKIANADYRGPRPQSSETAFWALMDMGRTTI